MKTMSPFLRQRIVCDLTKIFCSNTKIHPNVHKNGPLCKVGCIKSNRLYLLHLFFFNVGGEGHANLCYFAVVWGIKVVLQCKFM